jgi:hypothetical protein
VVPSPDVTTRVIVRASASSQSAQIGTLAPGQQLELIGSVPNWHEVRLPSGAQGDLKGRRGSYQPAAGSGTAQEG